MSWMFAYSPFNQELNNWNVSNVITMYLMFVNSQFNQNISGWNVGNVTIHDYFDYNSPIAGTSNEPNF